MFASAPSSRTASSAFAGAYRKVGCRDRRVSARSPHRLVRDAVRRLRRRSGAGPRREAQGHVEAKGRALGRAARIVDEGLKAPLDAAGGGLAKDLNDLYAYTTVRLTQANLRNDEAAMDECQRLIEPHADAWAASARRRPRPEAPRPPSLQEHRMRHRRPTPELLRSHREGQPGHARRRPRGDWDQVVKLEGACALLISQLKHNAARSR